MIRIEIAHELERAAVEQRMRALAERHDIAMSVTAVGESGLLTRKVPFLGSVEARYEIRLDALVVEVLKAPGSLQNTLQRMLADELGKALS